MDVPAVLTAFPLLPGYTGPGGGRVAGFAGRPPALDLASASTELSRGPDRVTTQVSTMLNILVSNQKEYSSIRVRSGPIVLGRNPKIGGLIHTIQDDYCSAQQLQVEELPGGRVRLTNLSKRVQV